MIMAMRAAVSTLDCRASRHSHSYCFPEFLYEVSNSAMMLPCQPLCSLCLSPFFNDCVTFMSTSGAVRRTTCMQHAIYPLQSSMRRC